MYKQRLHVKKNKKVFKFNQIIFIIQYRVPRCPEIIAISPIYITYKFLSHRTDTYICNIK
jgi:hypothetical protein